MKNLEIKFEEYIKALEEARYRNRVLPKDVYDFVEKKLKEGNKKSVILKFLIEQNILKVSKVHFIRMIEYSRKYYSQKKMS
jgi:hypothetical protein